MKEFVDQLTEDEASRLVPLVNLLNSQYKKLINYGSAEEYSSPILASLSNAGRASGQADCRHEAVQTDTVQKPKYRQLSKCLSLGGPSSLACRHCSSDIAS